MARKRVTEEMLERQRIREAGIAAIPELSDSVQQIVSRENFIRLFHELRNNYATPKEAYYFLESQHERITGEWKYSEYNSFLNQYYRWLRDEKRSPK